MARFAILCMFSCLTMGCEPGKMPQTQKDEKPAVALIIHGGAGTIRKENMSPERQQAYHDALKQALNAGYAVLDNGGSSIEAIIANCRIAQLPKLINRLWNLRRKISAQSPEPFSRLSGINTSGIFREKLTVNFHGLVLVFQLTLVDLTLKKKGII